MGVRWLGKRSFTTLLGSVVFLSLVQCGKGVSDDEEQEQDQGNPACDAACDDRCNAFATCGFDVQASCSDECKSSLQHAECRGFRPADQYTCDELEEVHQCAEYCHEFCVWASSCGSFDQQICIEGCAVETPPICNPASVAARGCDELKPEARMYDDVGRSLQEDDHSISGGSFANYDEFGLCKSYFDCTLPEACLLATNTCGPCAVDSDCDRASSSSHYVCSSGECLQVDCLVDDDCIFGRCEMDTHSCVTCLTDADCPGSFLATCEPKTHECVECLNDSDCADDPYFTRCDTANHHCVE